MRVLSLIHQDDAAAGVFAEVTDGLEEASFALGRPPARDGYDAALVFGGSMNVDEDHRWLAEEKVFLGDLIARDVPVLGVCLGAQLLAEAAGGPVSRLPQPEVGWHDVERLASDPVLDALPQRFRALEWHGYRFETPPGAIELARNGVGAQAFRMPERPVWGIQFHAEVTRSGLQKWIDDEDEPDPALGGTDQEIDRWNELGRGLCRAFLREAATRGR
jgi:GMP synthase-like glutamine amidotransferase